VLLVMLSAALVVAVVPAGAAPLLLPAAGPALLLNLPSAALGYRRGPPARAGLAWSVVAAALAACSGGRPAPALIGALWAVFALAAVPAALVCRVGVFDGLRGAVLLSAGVIALLVGAALASADAAWGPAAAAGGLGVFAATLAVARILRSAVPDTAAAPDRRDADPRANATRRSRSVPRRMIRDGDFHLLAIYGLLRLSDLAREGIENSGSRNFADHIYRGRASGITLLGRAIDALLLSLPAARAFRRRCDGARDAMLSATRAFAAEPRVRVLAVPCGIPRDLMELAAAEPAAAARIDYVGMDLDPAALDAAEHAAGGCPVGSLARHCGDALAASDYPPGPFHAAVSTGLGEFLDDDALRRFYRNVFDALTPGGSFYTSASDCPPRVDRLLRAFELHTHYRSAEQLEALLRELPWSQVHVRRDPTGLQAFARAVK
jgi:SAM-dependent methyltransferase